MARFSHDRMEGSLWGKGRLGFISGGLIVLILLIWVPAMRWFLGISVVIGAVMALVIHWYYEHTPIKEIDEDKTVLHLNDDEPDRSQR